MAPLPPAVRRQGPVLVVGDANLDLVLTGDVVPRFGQVEQLLDAADLTLGGSASIVAAGLGALGTEVSLVARIGDDLFGRLTLEALVRRGVHVAGIGTDPELPSALTVILSAPGDRAILTLPGAIPQVRGDDVTDEMLARCAHVHVASYFLLPGLAAGLPDLFARARSAGCTTSLDTNWDPAEAWAGVLDVLPLVDVLLPNTAELRAVSDLLPAGAGAGDVAARATALARLGPLVVVKDGAAGGLAATADGVLHAPAGVTDVVDTTGAGDSFDAGFLAAWADGHPVESCLRWAVAAGSLSTRALGGTPGQATRGEVAALVAGTAGSGPT